MDAASIVALIATGAGTFVGALWATSTRLVKPLQERMNKQAQMTVSVVDLRRILEKHAEGTVALGDFRKLRDDVQSLQALGKDLDRDIKDVQQALENLKDRLHKCVTDDEFAANNAQVVTLINGLSEKIGRATGLLEAWTQRSKPTET